MNRFGTSPQLVAFIIASLVVAGCSATPGADQLHNTVTQSATDSMQSSHDVSSAPAVTSPAVIALNSNLGALEYWPMRLGVHDQPIRISKKGLFDGHGLVAHGHVVSFANQYPPEVIQFDVDTKTITTLPDPYGLPVDIAIGKDNSLYVANLVQSQPSNVVWYPGGAPDPQVLTCSALSYGTNVAVDNEGNLYVGGYIGQSTIAGITKIPSGPNGPDPTRCKNFDLGLGMAGMEGVVVDPKTDDLVTLTNPGGCAGGVEGRMTIFPKPYRRETGIRHVVGRNCSFGMRLSADSKTVFILDETVDQGTSYVLQRSFPDGAPEGSYHGGEPTSITTIPNTLPN
jgi:beta-propeller repeat-containing protein